MDGYFNSDLYYVVPYTRDLDIFFKKFQFI